MRFGRSTGVERLGGLSGAAVFRVRFGGRTAILKHPASSLELHVYTRLGGLLRGHGVDIPRLLDHGNAGGTGWLLIEDIPTPLPAERRLADPEVLLTLRRLHHIRIDPALLTAGRYQPRWDATLTDTALAQFPAGTAALIRPYLDRLRHRALPLFAGETLISGDPNPRNWGVRYDGRLVLFDWERMTLATAALDLAITIPGLGAPADFDLAAREYLGDVPYRQVETLATDLRSVKTWTIIELLAELASAPDTPPAELDWLRATFPDWLRTLPD